MGEEHRRMETAYPPFGYRGAADKAGTIRQGIGCIQDYSQQPGRIPAAAEYQKRGMVQGGSGLRIAGMAHRLR